MYLTLKNQWEFGNEVERKQIASDFKNLRDFWNDHNSGNRQWDQLSGGGLTTTTTSYSSDVTLSDNNQIVLIDASAAARTVTLPTAVGRIGRQFTIKVSAGSNFVTIDADGSETIEGNPTFSLPGNGFVVTIVSDGANWRTI